MSRQKGVTLGVGVGLIAVLAWLGICSARENVQSISERDHRGERWAVVAHQESRRAAVPTGPKGLESNSQQAHAPESVSANPDVRPLSGRVVDEGATPIADVMVRADYSLRPSLTDVNGRFHIAVQCPAGAVGLLVVSKDGFATKRVPIPPMTFELNDIVLRKGVKVAGRIVDRGGGPVRGAKLKLMPDVIKTPNDILYSGLTDDTGVFAFDAAFSYHWRLTLHDPGALHIRHPWPVMRLDADAEHGSVEYLIDVVSEAELGSVTVAVRDEVSGVPLPLRSARVVNDAVLGQESPHVDCAVGSVRATGLQEGWWTCEVTTEDGRDGRQEFVVDKARRDVDIVIAIRPVGRISGRVVGASPNELQWLIVQSDRPLARGVDEVGTRQRVTDGAATLDGLGRFWFENVGCGRVRLDVIGGNMRGGGAYVEVVRNRYATQVVIQLTEFGEVVWRIDPPGSMGTLSVEIVDDIAWRRVGWASYATGERVAMSAFLPAGERRWRVRATCEDGERVGEGSVVVPGGKRVVIGANEISLTLRNR